MSATAAPRVPRSWWALAVFAALVVRFWALDLPFVERFNNISRQAMCASVARNLAEGGFRVFYPEIDTGAGPYLYNVEMPVYAIPMALLYRALGGAEEWAARLVSVLMSLVFLWAMTARARVWFGDRAAWAAFLFAALSPMSAALSRSIQPDITMMGFGMAAIHLFFRYLETDRDRCFWWSLFLMFLASLTRVFALHWMPLLLLVWTLRKGFGAVLRSPKLYVYGAGVLLSLVWYALMWWQGRHSELVFAPYDYARGDMRYLPYWRLFDLAHLKLAVKAFSLHLATPAGLVLILLGMGREPKAASWPLRIWTAAALAYLAAMWPTAMSHPYYLLPFLPLTAFWIGLGADRVWAWTERAPKGFAAAVLTAGAVLAAVPLGYYYPLLYRLPQDRTDIVRAGRLADAAVPPGDLIIASWEGSPIQLYYAHRKGWPLDLKQTDEKAMIAQLERYRSLGARWFVTPQTERLRVRPEFRSYLEERYVFVHDEPGAAIVDLRKGTAPDRDSSLAANPL